MSTVRINYDINYQDVEQADRALEDLNKTTDKTITETEELDDVTGSLSDQVKVLGNQFTVAGKGVGDLAAGMSGATKGIKTATTASKALTVAMKAIPILAIVGALTSLIAFFTKTERGAQKLRVIIASLEAVFGAVIDVVIKVGETLFDAVNSPQKALQDLQASFKSIFTEFIPNAIDNVVQGFGKLGQAVSALIKGDFQEAFEIAKEGSVQLLDGLTDLNPGTAILKSLAEGAIELGEEIQRDVEAAIDLENRLNALKVAQRELNVERAQANAEIERQKLIAEDLTRSFEERAIAAQKAFDLENKLLQEEIRLAQEQVAIIEQQNALSESSEEDLQNLADAQVALADVQQRSLTRQIELNNKLNTITQQERAEADAERAKIEADEEKRQERLAKLREDEAALTIFRLEQEDKLLEAEIERRALLLENEELNEAQRQLIIEQSEAAITTIKETEAKKQADIALKEAQSEIALINSVGTAVAQSVGEQTVLGKTAAVTQATINTYVAANKALASAPPPFSFILAAATIANGLQSVGNIVSTSTSTPNFTPKKLAKGELNIKGPGTATSDSIPAMLSVGESVMTAEETSKFLPTLSRIRRGDIDPDLLNGISSGAVKGGSSVRVVEVPRDQVTIDEEGFKRRVIKGASSYTVKQNRYSW